MHDPQPKAQQAEHESKFWTTAAITITAVLWGLSVVLPVWETRSDEFGNWSVVSGYFPALFGWLGLVVLSPAWCANFFLILSCTALFENKKSGFWISVTGLVIAASAYRFPGISGDNEEAVIVRRLIGFYLWLGSFGAIALAHSFLPVQVENKRKIVRLAVLILLVLGIAGLERIYKVGVSPLEETLKNPDDLAGFKAVLASNPPQVDKNEALWWAVRQELSQNRPEPSERVVMLIASGANPNKSDKWGNTLLIHALRYDSYVKPLVLAGADVNARDQRGRTILDIAKEVGSTPQVQNFLVGAGAHSSALK